MSATSTTSTSATSTSAIKIIDDVYWVGALHPERKLFDGLMPLDKGTSYNAYFVKGSEKTALIDTVDPSKTDELVSNLRELKVKQIDYIISNHAEQDHSGSIPKILKLYPEAKIVTNQLCKKMLLELHPFLRDEDFQTIADRASLPLGGKTLEFIIAPWVHWPETMWTFIKEDKVLFPCDYFGTHLGTKILGASKDETYEANKDYYAEIMMPFANFVSLHLQKVKTLDPKIIAPSHGPAFVGAEVKWIIDFYSEWSAAKPKNKAVIAYVTMHGSTEAMANHLAKELGDRGIDAKVFDLSNGDLGAIVSELIDSPTLIFASPTYLNGPHPLVLYAAYTIAGLRPKIKQIAMIGSFGWLSTTAEQMKTTLSPLKAEVLDSVVVKGYPKEADLESLSKLAETISLKHKSMGLGPP